MLRTLQEPRPFTESNTQMWLSSTTAPEMLDILATQFSVVITAILACCNIAGRSESGLGSKQNALLHKQRDYNHFILFLWVNDEAITPLYRYKKFQQHHGRCYRSLCNYVLNSHLFCHVQFIAPIRTYGFLKTRGNWLTQETVSRSGEIKQKIMINGK